MDKKETTMKSVEEILAGKTVTNETIVAAVNKYEEQRRERQQEKIIEQLKVLDDVEDTMVTRLRRVRRLEAIQKDRLQKFNAAKTQFMADADVDKYNAATAKIKTATVEEVKLLTILSMF